MEDYNLPSAERIVLLESLQEAIGDVPLYFWAFCQLCDMKALDNLVQIACINPAVVQFLAAQTFTAVLHWTQSFRGTLYNATPDTTSGLDSVSTGSPAAKRRKITGASAGSLLNRSIGASILAKERDDECCVLTSDPICEAAHIYPFCRLRGSEENTFGTRHMFWCYLKNFWPKEKVTAWEAELFPKGLSEPGTERVENLITLSKTAYAAWNQGAFALKPLSVFDNNTTLKVQFYWQRKQNDIQAPIMSLLTTPLSTKDLSCNEGAFVHAAKLFDIRTEQLLQSGQIIEIKTDDPIKKPLPSFRLLELQWFLTRVIGMAGAAFPYDPTSGDDWEEEGEDTPGFAEVGDTSVASDSSLSKSPEFLRNVNRLLEETLKHQTEEGEEGGGVGMGVAT